MAISRESGCLGREQSLGGLWSKDGAGRLCESQNLTVTTAAVLRVLSENQRRICALIENRGTGVLTLDFGASGIYSIAIRDGGSFQIDDNFPWTGIVNAIAETASCTVWATEVSIE